MSGGFGPNTHLISNGATDMTSYTAADLADLAAAYERWYDALDARDAARVANEAAADRRYDSAAYNLLYAANFEVEGAEMALDAVREAIG